MTRNIILYCFPCVLFLLQVSAHATVDDLPIYVDYAPFVSAHEAATSESSINWNGEDFKRQTACTHAFAATELQEHLRLLTHEEHQGAGFAITQWSGESSEKGVFLLTREAAREYAQLQEVLSLPNVSATLAKPQSFALIPDHKRLFIIGSDRVGTMYGAYQYLEFLGIRWYGPSDSERFVPKSAAIRFPDSVITGSPDFLTRGFWVTQDRGNKAFYLWMARNKLNFWSIAEPDRAYLQKLGMRLTYGGHSHFETFMNPTDRYPYNHPLFSGDEDQQADPFPANPESFSGDKNGDGLLSYFEARPDWYGLIDGQRTPFEGHLKQANICTANKEAIAHLNSNIVKELAEGDWKAVTYLNFWPVDMGKWCECDACKPLGSPTDRWLLMVHHLNSAIEVARSERRLHREVKVVFPIYLETLDAPEIALPDDFNMEACIGTFFPIKRCYVHSIDDPTCTEYNTEHWDTFLDWCQSPDRIYRGELFVGEYFNVSVNKSLPVLYTRIIDSDLPKYFHQGVRHMHYMHTDTRLLGPKRINNFLFAKKLWDITTNADSILEDYFSDLYGSVADEVEQLYAHLEFALSNIKQFRYWHHLPERITEGLQPLFDKEHFQLESTSAAINDGVDLADSLNAISQSRQIMDALLNQDLKADVRERLLLDDQHLKYGMNTLFFYDALARATLAYNSEDMPNARLHINRAIPYARALEAETELVTTAVNHHVHAKNGLDATRAEQAFNELLKQLESEIEAQ